LCELLWREWSPTWQFTPEMYAQTAASFENPDFVECVIHSYRHRNFNAPGEPRFVEVEKRLAERPPIAVPVITLHGADDGFGRPAADVSALDRAVMPQLIEKRIIEGAGHFVPHEKPEPVAKAIVDILA
jgi:pimeloyl-ACP methyl ester carboxylesterase